MSDSPFEEDDRWYPTERAYRVWKTVRTGGTRVWLLWEVRVHSHSNGEESYVSGGTLYASAEAENKSEAVKLGDSTDVHGSEVPTDVLEVVREKAENDAAATPLPVEDDDE